MRRFNNLVSTLFITLGIFSGFSQECPPLDMEAAQTEIKEIPGETMGQKLESLLFWSQEERAHRFSMMHALFPSIQVAAGTEVNPLQKGLTTEPMWKGITTLKSYMDDNHVKGVLVLKDGKIRLERYADGVDAATLWTSFSVAKSVSSMLVGVALKEGAIENLNDPLEKYIPELQGQDYGKVTVEQLLTMASGIDWNEDYEDPNSDVAQMYLKPCEGNEAHILTYMKPMKSAHTPGTKWNYSTGETDLTGILIQKATGKSLAEYLSEHIWKPFGMEHCAYWLADECSQMNIGGSGLSASLRDYARLGLLMLQNGAIEGRSVFSSSWLNRATSPHYPINDQGDGYGYLWWCYKDGSYVALGIFGQMLYINPHKNIVIAQMAAWPRAGSEKLSNERQNFIEAVFRALD